MKKKIESKEYQGKLRKVLEQRYCLRFSTVEESFSAVKRETTPFNTIALENFVIELDCTQAAKSIDEYKRSFSNEALCCNSSRGLSYFATVETLSIVIDYPPDTPNARIQSLLSSIFDDLFGDVVRWHSVSNEHIVCHFPPIFTSLLIRKILDKSLFCKEKKVKMITVGYCSVVYDKFPDKV